MSAIDVFNLSGIIIIIIRFYKEEQQVLKIIISTHDYLTVHYDQHRDLLDQEMLSKCILYQAF